MTIAILPADHEVRQRVRSDLGTTIFLQAGAGTGKTTVLVDRMVNLVASGVPMEAIAAITFTDAAAAELRGRVRLQLERAGADEMREAQERARCARGALDIDLAAIQTIHSFAGGLLRLFPLEAGLPPGFAVWNELEQDIAFRDRFRRWLYDEVPGDPDRERAVSLCLTLGLTASHIQNLAARLQDHYDLLDPKANWRTAELPAPVLEARAVGIAMQAAGTLVDCAHDPERDPLAGEVRAAQPVALRLLQAQDEEQALIALKRFHDLHVNAGRGRRSEWNCNADGQNAADLIRRAIKDANAAADGVLTKHRSAVLGDLLAHLRDFSLAFATERRAAGMASFHDLLVWARDLLRDHPDVRRRAHNRFQRLLIDEFQDTDPLQVEMAWFLTADPALAEETDWRKLRPLLGRLFVVGDAKQSIYRFRRADIGMYQDVQAALGEGSQVLELTQNFRSVGPLLDWVNHHLGAEMQPKPGVQPPYSKLHPRPGTGAESGLGEEFRIQNSEFSSPSHPLADPALGTGHPARGCNGPAPGAHRIGGPMEGKANERWLAEANAVACLARQIVAEGWQVTRGDCDEPRSARYEDICVLLPTRTNLRRLSLAFERERVPYRMESGSLVLNTPEVRDLLSCLRAIEDPSDQVALVAALRSPAYACSDVELLAWAEAGGRFDYKHPFADAGVDESTLNPAAARVRDALVSLCDFHGERHSHSSAATIELFIRDRLLAVQSFGHLRPREAWRRLRYVVGQARRLATAGQPSLRSALDWLEGLQRESFYDAESAVPEGDEDAVRFMTIHGSKGLEFPIVILTGLGPARPARGMTVAADRRNGRLEVHVKDDFDTCGYDADREAELDAAESLRLLYVATTRARDHLVLSLFHTAADKGPARPILARLYRVPELCPRLDVLEPSSVGTGEGRVSVPGGVDGAAAQLLVPEPVSPDSHRMAEEAWLAARQSLLEQYGSERRFTATSLAHSATRTHEPSPVAAVTHEPSPAAAGEGRVRVPARSGFIEPDEDELDTAPDAAEVVRVLRGGRAATSLGLAVHSVMQTIDLASLAGLELLAQCAAKGYGLSGREDELENLVRSAASSEAVQAALSTGRYWREVPVGACLEGTLLEGYIDLLYERSDGTLAVVDYKTDHVTAADVQTRLAAYRLQGGAYALAVQQAIARPVSSVDFVFAALGQSLALPDLDAVVAEVRLALANVTA